MVVGKCIQYGVRSASVPHIAGKPNVAVSSGRDVQRGSASKEQQAEGSENIMAGQRENLEKCLFFVLSL